MYQEKFYEKSQALVKLREKGSMWSPKTFQFQKAFSYIESRIITSLVHSEFTKLSFAAEDIPGCVYRYTHISMYVDMHEILFVDYDYDYSQQVLWISSLKF